MTLDKTQFTVLAALLILGCSSADSEPGEGSDGDQPPSTGGQTTGETPGAGGDMNGVPVSGGTGGQLGTGGGATPGAGGAGTGGIGTGGLVPPGSGYSSCGSGGPPASSWMDFTVEFAVSDDDHQGTEVGTVALLAPAPQDDKPMPLVVCFHGDEGTNESCKQVWRPVWEDRKDFLIAAVQNPWQDPNDPNRDETGWDDFVNDTSNYFLKIAEYIADQYPLDLDRVHVTGFSSGGWWMGQGVYRFQNIIAGAQFSCGASSWFDPSFYSSVAGNSACKIATRFEINNVDFLYPPGQTLFSELNELGHTTEFSDTACAEPGHCCGGIQEYGYAAMAWFDAHTLCGTTRSGCGTLGDVGAATRQQASALSASPPVMSQPPHQEPGYFPD